MWKDDVILRPATSPEDDWDTATVDMHRKFAVVRPCGFRDKGEDKQTYRYAYYTKIYLLTLFHSVQMRHGEMSEVGDS